MSILLYIPIGIILPMTAVRSHPTPKGNPLKRVWDFPLTLLNTKNNIKYKRIRKAKNSNLKKKMKNRDYLLFFAFEALAFGLAFEEDFRAEGLETLPLLFILDLAT